MTFQDFKFIISQCFQGSSMLRAHQNLDFKKRVSVHGDTIDLGAKDAKYAYHQLISKADNLKMTYTDLYPKADGIIKIDFNKKFNLSSDLFDNAMLFNVLEHVWDTRNLLLESHRILSQGGTLYGAVPFLFRHHTDPVDYWRFTSDAMEGLLKESGFKNIEVRTHGVGCFTVSANTFVWFFRFKPLVAFVWSVALILDHLLSKIWPNNQTFYLGLYFQATK